MYCEGKREIAAEDAVNLDVGHLKEVALDIRGGERGGHKETKGRDERAELHAVVSVLVVLSMRISMFERLIRIKSQ